MDKNGWISTDSPPAHTGDGYNYKVLAYDIDLKQCVIVWNDEIETYHSYWQPLPSPPKTEQATS